MTLRRFLARLIWACVLPLVALSAWLAIDSLRNALADADRHAQTVTKNSATSIDQLLIGRIGALNVLAQSPLIDDPARWPEFYRLLQNFPRNFGAHVVFADNDMRMLFNTRVPFGTALPALPRPAGFAAAPAALETGKPAVGDRFEGPIAGQHLVAVAVPVLREGKPTRLLLATFTPDVFAKRMALIALPEGSAITLLDGSGTEIATHAQSARPATSGDPPSQQYVARSAMSNWTVRMDIPTAVYLAPVYRAGAGLALAILLTTLSGVLGGLFASRRLDRALRSLTHGAAGQRQAAGIEEIDEAQRRLDEAAARRQTAEIEARASEGRFAATFEQAAVGIALVAPDGRWLRVNRRLCDIVGYTEAELMQSTFQEITVADDLYADLGQVRSMLAREIDTYSMEKRYIRKDGATVWVLLTVALTWKPDGTPDYFISVIEDIDARKRAETELHMWTEVFAKSQLALAIADAPSNRFIAVSPLFAAERGFTPADLVGMPLVAVYPPDRLQALKERIGALDATGHGIFETEHLCRDGRRFPVLMDITVIKDDDGTPRTRVAYALDITARKQSEAQLRQQADHLRDLSDRLMRAQEDERRMLAHELHDEIGQQLAALKLNLKSIARNGLSAPAGERLEDCIAINDTAIEQLRDTALALRPAILDELGLCAALRWYCRRQGKRAGIAIYLNEEALPVEPGDPARITAYRIVQEAVNNAIRHARPTRIEVFVGGSDHALEVSVDDDGCGIGGDSVEREPGLGLLGMRERTGWLGGTFEIHSAPGKGTRVVARFPLEGTP